MPSPSTGWRRSCRSSEARDDPGCKRTATYRDTARTRTPLRSSLRAEDRRWNYAGAFEAADAGSAAAAASGAGDLGPLPYDIPEPKSGEVSACVDLLLKAKRPVFVLGR